MLAAIRPLLGLALALFFMIGGAQPATSAGVLDQLMSPGKLSRAHEKLEENCANCHEQFNKKGQTKLCLTCHKEIANDIKAKLGFHGRSARPSTAECGQCHTEHKGREANLTAFDRETFDHRFTDYPLNGAHAGVACVSCHKPGAKFRNAPSTCIDCHRKDDRHQGRLGTSCAGCHSEAGWKQTKFDHATTGFALQGKHATTACAGCHASGQYKGTPRTCFACHQLDDKHQGRNGTKCESCHTVAGWSAVTFDHSRQTRFALTGRHASLACNACHTGSGAPGKLPMTCVSCHQKDDAHKGGNGPKCESCHNAASWKQTSFNHDRDTHFPLRGAHSRASCQSCHGPGPVTAKIESTCISCHRKDDAHKGQEGSSCGRCHNETAWSGKVTFDHGLTRFPLIGLHATTPCEECHLTTAYRDAATRCVDCHKKDDTHKGALGADCAQCHNPNGWAYWEFDHDKQTRFPLTGKHEGLACNACHIEPADGKVEASTNCATCHAKDDVHKGEFGSKCDSCHSTESFRQTRVIR